MENSDYTYCLNEAQRLRQKYRQRRAIVKRKAENLWLYHNDDWTVAHDVVQKQAHKYFLAAVSGESGVYGWELWQSFTADRIRKRLVIIARDNGLLD